MTIRFGEWTIGLNGEGAPDRKLIGGKAWSVARMQALGLNVPSAVVITTRACGAFTAGQATPPGLDDEIAAGVAWLEERTDRRFGAGPRPLLVSVRSGAPVSMPGMMDTVLNLGINDETEAALAEECGDPLFARNTHRRFLDLYAHIVVKADSSLPDNGGDPALWREAIRAATGVEVPHEAHAQLRGAIRAVFESWNSRRARRYRQHHDIPDDLGTAVTIQAMVGNLDGRSGTGVLFSRNPLTGEPAPYGEYLPRAQGEDVVSGRFTPEPLPALAHQLPAAHASLFAAAQTLERAGREVQDIEFTIERGQLFFLQSRAAKLSPYAAARIAIDLVREGLVDEEAALRRITPDQVRILLAPRQLVGVIGERLARIEGDPHETCLCQRVIGDETVDAVRQQHADPVASAKAAVEKAVAQPVRQRVELAGKSRRACLRQGMARLHSSARLDGSARRSASPEPPHWLVVRSFSTSARFRREPLPLSKRDWLCSSL
jgi:pyruvate, orthophosphate dikinase